MKKPVEEWEKEFYENVQFDEAELGSNWSMDDIVEWIKKNFISRSELEEGIEKLFDDYRSSNIKDENGKRVFGVADFNVGLRKLHKNILQLIKEH